MSDLPDKRVASWPTLRDSTLVVDIKYPAPGQALVDIRRHVGPSPDNLVPGFVGVMIDPSEIPALMSALADTMTILAGGAPEAARTSRHVVPQGDPAMPSFLRDMMHGKVGAAEATPHAANAPEPEPTVPEAAKGAPEAEAPNEPDAPAGAQPPRRRSGIATAWR